MTQCTSMLTKLPGVVNDGKNIAYNGFFFLEKCVLLAPYVCNHIFSYV